MGLAKIRWVCFSCGCDPSKKVSKKSFFFAQCAGNEARGGVVERDEVSAKGSTLVMG